MIRWFWVHVVGYCPSCLGYVMNRTYENKTCGTLDPAVTDDPLNRSVVIGHCDTCPHCGFNRVKMTYWITGKDRAR